jgi:hypothetical protein
MDIGRHHASLRHSYWIIHYFWLCGSQADGCGTRGGDIGGCN